MGELAGQIAWGNEAEIKAALEKAQFDEVTFQQELTFIETLLTTARLEQSELSSMAKVEQEKIAAASRAIPKIEKASGISNPKDFRAEAVNFVLRQKAAGKEVPWTSYEKMRKVIEDKMFSATDELLPIISFGSKSNKEDEKKHAEFVDRMCEKGYTPRQVRRLTEWYLRVQKAN